MLMLLFVLLLDAISGFATTNFTSDDFGGRATVLGNIYFVHSSDFGGRASVEGDLFVSQVFGGTAHVTGWSNSSPYWKFTVSANFSSPNNVDATRYNKTNIRLTWDTSPNATKTIIRYSNHEYPKLTQGIEIYNGTLEYFNHTGLQYCTPCYYSLYGYSPTLGVSGNTTVTNVTEPDIPSGVSQLANWSTKISMGWTKGFNASHTVIYSINGTEQTLRYNGTNTSALISNLTTLKNYHFHLYSYNQTYNVLSSVYTSFNASTSYSTTPPTSFKATSYNDTRIYLTWTKGSGSNTVIKRSNISFPSNYSGGTTVYSGTGSSCYDTGLNASMMYYYRAWSVAGSSYSDLNAIASNYTRPQPPLNGSSTYNVTDFTVHLKWMNGNGSTNMTVMRKTTGYPTSPTDGTNVSFFAQNITWNYYNKSVITTNYFTVYSYNNTTGFYSRTGLDIPWGAVGVNCYNESNPSQALTFNLEITNQPGTMVYKRIGITNTHFIDAVNNMPTGNNVIFIVESTGYRQRIYYKDISLNIFYNFSFYLPPTTTPGGDGGGGTTEDCTLRAFTNSMFISNPGIDANITFSYPLEDMIQVEIYNSTLYGTYGGWMFITEDNYTYNSAMVSIDEDVLDQNTVMARVAYYYWYCPNETIETPLYYLRVIETTEGQYSSSDMGVDGAIVNIKRYINTSGIYVNVSSLLTDANGYVNVYLIPNTLYKINITKEGYYPGLSDYIPAQPNQYGQTDIKIFKIIKISPDTDLVNYTEPVISAVRSGTTIYMNYTDAMNETLNVTMYIYYINATTGNETLITTFYSTTNNTVNNAIYNTNLSLAYKFLIIYNHTHYGNQSLIIILDAQFANDVGTVLNTILTAILGPAGPFIWTNVILFIMFAVLMFHSDKKNSGKYLILIGGIMAFVAFIGFGSAVSGIIPVLFVMVGIILEWINAHR